MKMAGDTRKMSRNGSETYQETALNLSGKQKRYNNYNNNYNMKWSDFNKLYLLIRLMRPLKLWKRQHWMLTEEM